MIQYYLSENVVLGLLDLKNKKKNIWKNKNVIKRNQAQGKLENIFINNLIIIK